MDKRPARRKHSVREETSGQNSIRPKHPPQTAPDLSSSRVDPILFSFKTTRQHPTRRKYANVPAGGNPYTSHMRKAGQGSHSSNPPRHLSQTHTPPPPVSPQPDLLERAFHNSFSLLRETTTRAQTLVPRTRFSFISSSSHKLIHPCSFPDCPTERYRMRRRKPRFPTR